MNPFLFSLYLSSPHSWSRITFRFPNSSINLLKGPRYLWKVILQSNWVALGCGYEPEELPVCLQRAEQGQFTLTKPPRLFLDVANPAACTADLLPSVLEGCYISLVAFAFSVGTLTAQKINATPALPCRGLLARRYCAWFIFVLPSRGGLGRRKQLSCFLTYITCSFIYILDFCRISYSYSYITRSQL